MLNLCALKCGLHSSAQTVPPSCASVIAIATHNQQTVVQGSVDTPHYVIYGVKIKKYCPPWCRGCGLGYQYACMPACVVLVLNTPNIR